MRSKNKYILLILPALLLLAEACSVGKNYKRPQLNLPGSYRNTETSADSNSVGDLAWKDLFSDAVLQRLIDSTLARNMDMQIALKNIESSKQVLKQSNAAFAPDLDFRIGAGSTIPSGNSLNGISLNSFLGTNHIEDFTAAVSLSWEIDIWGKIRRQKEAAQADYLRTWEAVRTVQTRLVYDVAAGYYTLLMLDAQLEAAKKNLALNDTVLEITRVLKNVGRTTELAVQIVESQQQAAALLIPRLEQQINIQETSLHILAGQFPSGIERSARLEDVELTDDLSTGFPVSIVGRRPDVKSAELKLKAMNARVGMAAASMYPSLVINLSGGLNSFIAGNWFNIPGSIFGAFAGGLTQPLFHRRQLKTQLELAKIERDKAAIEFRQSVINAAGEVSNGLIKVEKMKEQQRIANQRVQSLQLAVDNARLLFENGMATYLEVVTAQSNLLQAELEAYSITAGLYMAKVELYRALGGGWR